MVGIQRNGRTMDPDTPAGSAEGDGESTNASGASPDNLREAAWRVERFEELAGSLGVRLSRVCSHLPDDDFAELVREIAAMSLRFEERDPVAQRMRARSA